MSVEERKEMELVSGSVTGSVLRKRECGNLKDEVYLVSASVQIQSIQSKSNLEFKSRASASASIKSISVPG